ncbi:class I SAM-dependent methyltransferase [Thioflexithrix psekupsensis]|uniref:Methyltransferase type 11 domain-containing protein n=1 Tax=Thioflexithrix psekupsensis TaxID=1570016 RepID=A0A251X3X1_9GAMM|nr:class I SAM-dependent methyltransferase [Thioflexithrix psekupsensis]OUD12151.1 hypothetical protein TPSD3_13570 [Thioflexithrix psekupsensis]
MSKSTSNKPILTEANFDNVDYFLRYPDVAQHPAYQGVPNGGWLHWVQYGKSEGRQACALDKVVNPTATTPSLAHRQQGYHLLNGQGLEIGALHQPAQLPKTCTVEYCDVAPREVLITYFPELKVTDLVEIHHVCDLDKEALSIFPANHYDFIIINHVIEHVANPIRVIEELFRVIKPGGCVVISAPDKDFTFDKRRNLTPFAHLLEEYRQNVTEVTDEHYLDFLQAVHPERAGTSPDILAIHLQQIRDRREHAHVWDSQSFEAFMQASLALLRIEATCIFSHKANEGNYFEYFSVWRK